MFLAAERYRTTAASWAPSHGSVGVTIRSGSGLAAGRAALGIRETRAVNPGLLGAQAIAVDQCLRLVSATVTSKSWSRKQKGETPTDPLNGTCQAAGHPLSRGDQTARRMRLPISANAGAGSLITPTPWTKGELHLPKDRIREPDADLTPDLAHSPVDSPTVQGYSGDLTPDQQRLCTQGLRLLARMIVEHTINHPDEHERWMADTYDDPAKAA